MTQASICCKHVYISVDNSPIGCQAVFLHAM